MARTDTAPAPPMRESVTTLTPYELADLLGVDRADAGYLSTSDVRLPSDFVRAWNTRLGPRELTVAEVSVITAIAGRTLLDWLASKSLVGRRVAGSGRGYRVSPQSLVAFLKAKNDGPVPVVVESATQERKRMSDSQRRVADRLAGNRRR